MQIFPVFLPFAGCPHRCRFCRQPEAGETEPEAVAAGLAKLLPERGEGEIAFYGGTFTLLPDPLRQRWLAAAASFRAAGRVGGVRISTRPDAVSADIVDELRRWGVTTVELGCQSFAAEVLDLCHRGHGPEAAAAAVGELRRAGLRVGLQLMPGLPGGDRNEAIASLLAAIALEPDFLRLYPALVFRGTPLEEDWRRGAYRPWSLAEAVDVCAEMLWRCWRAGVPVIRLGLQEEAGLARQVAAGPWHPAFGQLVRSRLWLLALGRLGREFGPAAEVSKFDLGDALGHRRANLAALEQDFGRFTITPRPELPRHGLAAGGRRGTLWDMTLYGSA